MQKYIALLRGINVGGNNKISMMELKEAFLNNGFHSVLSYINSGNIIFDSEISDENLVQAKCEKIIEDEFALKISVYITTVSAFAEVIENAPIWWGTSKDSVHNAIFVISPATAQEIWETVGITNPEHEKVYCHKNVIFWSAPIKTFSRAKWSKISKTKEYHSITIRNENTTRKLIALAKGVT